MKTLILMLIVAVMSGCAGLHPETISASPAGGIDIANETVVKDILAAKFNLDEAVKIGVLDVNDPAPYCLADVVKKAGLDGPAAASFKPRYEGIASAAAVAYIEARKLEKLKAEAKIDVSCEALIGRIVIDAMKAARKVATPSITGLLR